MIKNEFRPLNEINSNENISKKDENCSIIYSKLTKNFNLLEKISHINDPFNIKTTNEFEKNKIKKIQSELDNSFKILNESNTWKGIDKSQIFKIIHSLDISFLDNNLKLGTYNHENLKGFYVEKNLENHDQNKNIRINFCPSIITNKQGFKENILNANIILSEIKKGNNVKLELTNFNEYLKKIFNSKNLKIEVINQNLKNNYLSNDQKYLEKISLTSDFTNQNEILSLINCTKVITQIIRSIESNISININNINNENYSSDNELETFASIENHAYNVMKKEISLNPTLASKNPRLCINLSPDYAKFYLYYNEEIENQETFEYQIKGPLTTKIIQLPPLYINLKSLYIKNFNLNINNQNINFDLKNNPISYSFKYFNPLNYKKNNLEREFQEKLNDWISHNFTSDQNQKSESKPFKEQKKLNEYLSFYKINEVDFNNASQQEKEVLVGKAFRNMTRLHHPDRYQNIDEKKRAEETMKQINKTHSYLKSFINNN